jgi:hypothetical protein
MMIWMILTAFSFLSSHEHNAANEGILDVHQGLSTYRFAHDKIYEAIYFQVLRIGNVHKTFLGRLLLHLENKGPEDNSLNFLAAKQSHHCLSYVETSYISEVLCCSQSSYQKRNKYPKQDSSF